MSWGREEGWWEGEGSDRVRVRGKCKHMSISVSYMGMTVHTYVCRYILCMCVCPMCVRLLAYEFLYARVSVHD